MLAVLIGLAPWRVAADPSLITLAGHGGPITSIAITQGTDAVLTASFDTSLGLWNGSVRWLEAHDAGVNDVAFINRDMALSGGDDGRVLVWELEQRTARPLIEHRGRVVSLDVAPDGRRVASASWDGTVGLTSLVDGQSTFLKGHAGPVNDVLFSADGQWLYTASSDGTIRVWDIAGQLQERVLVEHGFGVNVLARDAVGNLAFGAINGALKVVSPIDGSVLADLSFGRRPILSIAAHRETNRLAIGDSVGRVTVVMSDGWRVEDDVEVLPSTPLRAMTFSPGGETLYVGTPQGITYGLPISLLGSLDALPTGATDTEDELDHGARQFARNCSGCHTLSPDGLRRAGPTLYRVFGRRAGSVADYRYSAALEKSDIVWDKTTISELFRIGPNHYIPGTKMPLQKIIKDEDRDALVSFLERNSGLN